MGNQSSLQCSPTLTFADEQKIPRVLSSEWVRGLLSMVDCTLYAQQDLEAEDKASVKRNCFQLPNSDLFSESSGDSAVLRDSAIISISHIYHERCRFEG